MPATSSDAIVCKPTPWFLWRAVAMLLMFGGFSAYFFYDGAVGYRKKNVEYYLRESFRAAVAEFGKRNSGGTLTEVEWKEYAAGQNVKFPEDPYLLPKDFKQPVPWPEVLHDYGKMKPLQDNLLWDEYSGRNGYSGSTKISEKAKDRGTIREQWFFAYLCGGLALASGFFLIRTIGRSITADDKGVKSQDGKLVPYGDLKVLDLRKWETKGLAFADYEGASGKGRLRIDGLTYGGFKKEDGEPAEKLMQRIRGSFSGEIIEYTAAPAEEDAKSEPVPAKSDGAAD